MMEAAGVTNAGSRSRRRWTRLIGTGMSLWRSRRRRLLSDRAYWATNAREIQIRQLRGLLARAAYTELGRKHNFEALARRPDTELLAAYREAIPNGDYEQWREDLARMREGGEPDILWPGIIRDWAQTSGTTGGEKYIPVSKQMMHSNFRAALDIFAHAERFGVNMTDMFAGHLLMIGGSTAVETNEHGIRTGDLSGLVTPMIRWPLTRVYTPGMDIALMSDWPAKIDAMAERCMSQDIRMVNGMASWGLILFRRVLELARERNSDSSWLRDVWPNLRLFVHGGVKYTPFESRVSEAWSGDPEIDLPCRLEVYPASEGFIAMSDTKGDPGLRLLTDIGIYYEFVPLEEIGTPNARSFLCDEVERGQRYVVTMSTCAGLWRYTIGDVVEFDTIPPDGPPRLRIVGRHRHFVNAFGENLIVEEIENAVASAAKSTQVTVGEFTAAPVYPNETRAGGLELAIEWEADASKVSSFRDAFDDALKQQNVDYTTKRTSNLGMAAPTITTLRPGAIYAWMESEGKLGGQHKAPRCANHREILDAILAVGGASDDLAND